MASFLKENIRISFQAIKSQFLRAALTALIISFGITALIAILTSIDAIKTSINSNFTSMGANTFTIRNRATTVRIGRQGKGPKVYKNINYSEAVEFKNRFNFLSTPSVSAMATMSATMKFESKKTNPNIQVFGGDENYLATAGYELSKGRNFSNQEVQYGTPVVLLGTEIVEKLFTKKQNPIDQIIAIGSGKYKVIGLLKSKGSSMGMGGDKIAIIPVNNVRQYFSRPNMTFTINVVSDNTQLMDVAVGEATGLFRSIRKIPNGEEDNFEISKSDNLAGMLIDNIKKVTMGATAIGFITLFGAAIGLMNIMLVSVTERTREIGIRKAVGATKKIIRTQFLIEAIIICQIGGILGILLGITIGNLISFNLGIGFIIPWLWISGGIVLCLFVGIISGIYPAIKASNLDPIEALRFE